MSLVCGLDGVLQHPTAISEKLGLAHARELVRDPAFGKRIADRMRTAPSRTAPGEPQVLAHSVLAARNPMPDLAAPVDKMTTVSTPPMTEPVDMEVGGVHVKYGQIKAKIDLPGANIDDALFDDLTQWIGKHVS